VSSAAVSERQELARSFDDSLGKILRLEDLLRATAEDRPLPDGVQVELIGLGWHGVALAEDQGGLGLDPLARAQLAAVAGRRLLPSALRNEAFLLAPLLAALAAEGDEQAAAWLEGLLAGEKRGGGGVVPAGGAPDAGAQLAWLAPGGIAWLAPQAALVALAGEDGFGAVLDLDAGAAELEPFAALDRGQGATRVTPSGPPAHALAGAADVVRGWRLASLCEAFGAGQRALELAVEYAGEREQFGRPIASFQAISHQLARAAVDIEAAEAGIGRLAAGPADDELLTILCHWVPAAARRACECSIQVHGGMGFTWELGLHLYYRRVLAIQAHLGGESASARAVGRTLMGSKRGR
jgi:alkylation response protein AidB-like acyl-CoA dehydrogenase